MKIIDELDDLKDDVHTNVDLYCEQICKDAKKENLQRLVEVIARPVKRKRDSGSNSRQILTGSLAEGMDI